MSISYSAYDYLIDISIFWLEHALYVAWQFYHLAPVAIIIFSLITLAKRFRPDGLFLLSFQWPLYLFVYCWFYNHWLQRLIFSYFEICTVYPWAFGFFFFATLKFSKLIVHTIAFYVPTYRRVATQLPEAQRAIFPRDVTVVIPSTGELNLDPEFGRCLDTILRNNPHQVIISTVGQAKQIQGEAAASEAIARYNLVHETQLAANKIVVVHMSGSGSKRAQLALASHLVTTLIMCYADDHVFWPDTYIESVLTEFENPEAIQRVGLVGTVKSVTRQRKRVGWPWAWKRDNRGGFFGEESTVEALSDNLRNFFACIYLERHNFECTATYNLDGGVFVMSGRTAFIRTVLFTCAEFQGGYMDDRFGFDLFGHYFGTEPMKVDDDNYTTRCMVNHNYATVFRNAPDCIMDNSLGTNGGWTKFKGQLLRWARTTYRSNITTLYEGKSRYANPWTTYAMFIQSFFNISIFQDGLLYVTLWNSGFGSWENLCLLTLLEFLSKMVKSLEYYKRYPQDLVYIPAQLLFGLLHGGLRIWAFFTMHDITWAGRAVVTAD